MAENKMIQGHCRPSYYTGRCCNAPVVAVVDVVQDAAGRKHLQELVISFFLCFPSFFI